MQCHCPPHFDYVDVVYDAAPETNESRLQRLQTRAARLISGTGPRDSKNPVFKKSLDFYHLKIEDLCINVLWFLNLKMA